MIPQPKIRIAYADDHEIVRKGIIQFINTSENAEVVIEANNGKDLIRQLEKAPYEPDLCLLDINMPEMNGFETIVEVKKKWPDIKVLVLTVFDNELYIIRMILNGANGYITKGSSPDELINAIKIIFKHGMYYSTHFTRPLINAIKQNLINIPNITPREQQVLKLSCSDLSYAEIAKRIRVSIRSVDGFRESLFRKLRVNSRTGLALFAVQFGFVPIDVNINGNLKKNL